MLLQALVLAALFAGNTIIAQDDFQSPCPRLFVYEGKGNETGIWYGIVTLLSETNLEGIWLRLIFDRPSLQLGNWFGEVVTTDNKEYLVKNRMFHLKAHTPQTIRFYLKYKPSDPAPKLTGFRLNARVVCPEGLSTETPPPTMMLQTSGQVTNVRTTPIPPNSAGGDSGRPNRPEGGNFPWNNHGSSSTEEDDFFIGDLHFVTQRPDSRPKNKNLDEICGTVVTKKRKKRQTYQYPSYSFLYEPNKYRYQYYPNQYYDSNINNNNWGLSGAVSPIVRTLASFLLSSGKDKFEVDSLQTQARPLITYGQETHEGEFPWHAALYHARGIDLVYICGASLITTSHVLTVAHCITKLRSSAPLNPDNLLVYLGKYYLKRLSSAGLQNRQVAEIFPHPQYNPQAYRNDIAVMKLVRPSDITDYVRPICLWQDSPDLGTVLNKQGSVVGWGFDETGKVTETLMQTKMPIVSQETCLFSFPDFYSRFTSNNTYCAGFRNGTSVCNGDSGGGMVFPKPGSSRSNPRWQIRGLVSISVARQNQFRCDTSHYVVFTDVAKYLDWIKKTIKL